MNKINNNKKVKKNVSNNAKNIKGKKVLKEKNYNFNKDNKEENFHINQYNGLNFNTNINNFSNIDPKYRKQLNDRMDLLMEKIDQNINNNNYNQLNMIIHNSKINYINNYNGNNNIYQKDQNNNQEEEEIYNYKNIQNDNNINDIGEIIEEKSEEEISQKLDSKAETVHSKKKEEQIMLNINNNKENEEINNKLIKRNKNLESEVNYLRYKLNRIQNQKDFVQNIIMNNDNLRRQLFDIFTVGYFNNIALNWKEVSDGLIDELIIDEIHELTKLKLKYRQIERNEEEKRLNENNNGVSSIDIEEFMIFNENLKGIKQTIKSVKETENNLCKKYKIKIND